jgi:TPR repeat protein
MKREWSRITKKQPDCSIYQLRRDTHLLSGDFGKCYTEGVGVEKDFKEAVKWVRLAAEAGVVDAQSLLGTFYMHGQGVEKDVKEAVKWLSMAAENGNPFAQFRLGYCYLKGIGVEMKYMEGLRWLMMAIEEGCFIEEFQTCGIDRADVMELMLADEDVIQAIVDKAKRV